MKTQPKGEVPLVTKTENASDNEAPDEASYIGEIDDILGFHIRLAHGTAYRHFMQSFKFLDMTQKQVSVLWLVSDHPGVAQADLAKRLQLDRATVMAIVNRLAMRKFLVRGESATDGRKQTLKLLPTGAKALQEAKRAIRAHEKWLKGRFTAKELKTLISLLRRIHGPL
jgi:DNA-binding MarR family transcriptional regulator